MKNKLLFVHIPKCAGQSVLSAINHNILDKRKDKSLYIGNPQEEEAFGTISSEETSKYKFIGGHVPFPKFKNKIGEELISDFFIFTIVRDPVDRAISLYNYILNTPIHFAYEQVSNLSFEEFLLSKYYFKNHQSFLIGGQDDWKLASEIIKTEFDFAVTVSNIDKLIAEICNYFEVPIIKPTRKNVGKLQSVVKKNLSSDIMEKIRILDPYDVSLFESVKESKLML